LASAFSLVSENRYPAALTVIRTALEHHLVDRLIFLGTASVEEWRRGERKVAEYERELEDLRLSGDSTVRLGNRRVRPEEPTESYGTAPTCGVPTTSRCPGTTSSVTTTTQRRRERATWPKSAAISLASIL
jgi:hypothetical protein